ncbi:MAG TPA: class I SAM-dependent methyltransferase [Solirubrobacteraceae bacterium]
MDASRRALAAQILGQARAHDELQSDRVARFRNVEPETAELLSLLVRSTRARRILELGTSNGYSTIWLADAAEATGGTVTSVEIEASRTALARERLERAGLQAELLTQDAAATLAQAPDGHYDLVFLDAERPAYAGYWPDLLRVLRRDGGLLVIDNVLSHAGEVVEVGALIDAERRVARVELAIGAGVWLVVHGA